MKPTEATNGNSAKQEKGLFLSVLCITTRAPPRPMSRYSKAINFGGREVTIAHGFDRVTGYFLVMYEEDKEGDDVTVYDTASFFGNYDKEIAIPLLEAAGFQEAALAIVLDIPY